MASTPFPDEPTLDMRGVTPDGETLRSPGSASPVAPDGGRPFGRYRLLDELGRGGMGVVWRAWDPGLQRVVALKMIGGEDGPGGQRVERFAREAQAAARLRHPNVIAVHDVGVEEGQHYFVTEYVAGGSLDKRLDGLLPVRRAVELVRSVAEALHYAHGQGIIHRDVKPGNILVDDAWRPYVMDFGLARQVDRPEGTSLTLSGDLLGTPSYMSPEQASGRVELHGPATDQFSLGVVLFQLLTGRLPFEAPSLQGLLNAITDREPPRLRLLRPDLPADLETVCLKAMEKEPSQRYADLGDVARELGRFLEGEPVRARASGPVARLVRLALRHRAGVVLSLFAAIAIVGVPYFWRRAEDESERRRRADESLRKAGLVQNVFMRWGRLTEPLRRLEAVHYGSTSDLSARRSAIDAAWPAIEAFRRETPADPTSQSAMMALAGWARWLAGPEEEGIGWMRKARELDPDLPYGALLEALTCISRYLLELQPESLSIGMEKVDYGPLRGERPELRELKERIVALLGEAARAEVWGDQVGADARVLLQAMQAYHAGQYEESESALSVVLVRPSMQVFENELLMARAGVRLVRMRFQEAVEDAERVGAAHADQAFTEVMIGLIRGAEAVHLFSTEGGRAKALGALQQSMSHLSTAIERDPSAPGARFYRGAASWGIAEVQVALRMDPRMALAQAIGDLTIALTLDPTKRAAILTARGLACLSRARDAVRRKADASADFSAAAEDFSAVIDAGAGKADDLNRRGCARLEWGAWVQSCGKDAGRFYDEAIADFSVLVEKDASNLGARRSHAVALDRRADAGGLAPQAGKDLRERAVAELTLCIDQDPQAWRDRITRGHVLRKLGRATEALADMEAAKALSGGKANLDGLIEELRAESRDR